MAGTHLGIFDSTSSLLYSSHRHHFEDFVFEIVPLYQPQNAQARFSFHHLQHHPEFKIRRQKAGKGFQGIMHQKPGNPVEIRKSNYKEDFHPKN